MSQKWKRCWFVLKGHTLYWYNSENDEKAEGLIKLSSYTVEAAGEHKRKFVFQLCHRKFKSFVFSADNVDEMRKWINSIISAVQKYKTEKHYENKEEDCWSETETEECDDSPDVPPASRAKSYLLAQRISDISVTEQLRQSVGDYVQSGQGGVPSSGPSSPSKEKELISEPSQNSNDELEVLMKMLEQGGLSLIGKEQPFRKDYHQSFIRRNKNPIINEKVHNLRALKSTLKAKIVDLQSINKILEDPHLTAAKYRVWKEGNQELLADIQKARQLAKKGRRAKAEHPSIPEQDLQLEAMENSFTWFNTGQISTETSMSVLHELEDNQVTCSGSTSPQSGTGEYDCKEGMHTQQDLDIDRIQRCP